MGFYIDFIVIQWDVNGIYPLVMTYKKRLKPWPSRNSGFSHESHGDFP